MSPCCSNTSVWVSLDKNTLQSKLCKKMKKIIRNHYAAVFNADPKHV